MSVKDDLESLQGMVDEAVGTLRDAYRPEATRGELAEAIGQALDALEAEEEETEAGEAEEDDGEEDDDEASA